MEPHAVLEHQGFSGLLGQQTAEWAESLLELIREELWASRDRVVVLDDDPTGTQTVSGVEVLMEWSLETIARAILTSRVFFVLTNSRSVPEPEAIHLNREIGTRLAIAASQTDVRLRLASRSNSTLRGHFPAEVEALADGAAVHPKAILLLPSFPEGGRFTLGDIHWAQLGPEVVPVAETAYAHDPVFGYSLSWLPGWVEEKTGGRIQADQVKSVGLEMIRADGPAGVADLLQRVPTGSVVVVNAVSQRDLEVVARAVQMAESVGLDFVYRTAASFVRVRGGIQLQPPLARSEIFRDAPDEGGPGLVVCGSHVPLSTAQVSEARSRPGVVGIEVDVGSLYRPGARQGSALREAAKAASQALAAGKHALVYTTREYRALDPFGPLVMSRSVAEALAGLVEQMSCIPAFVVAKGGATSSVLATQGLQMKSAMVMGQVVPGVPVWSSDSGRWPYVPYIVFPGTSAPSQPSPNC